MKRVFLLALCLLALSSRARAQATSAASEHLCTHDSITVSRGSRSLVEGLRDVSLTWTASVSNPDWYNVYRGASNGGPYTQIASCVRGTSYLDPSVPTGGILYYVVTAVLRGAESTYSTQAIGQIPVFDTISVVPNYQGLPSEMSPLRRAWRSRKLFIARLRNRWRTRHRSSWHSPRQSQGI